MAETMAFDEESTRRVMRKAHRSNVRVAPATRPGELAHQRRVAVVGPVGADDPPTVRRKPSHADRDLVGLGSGAREHDALERSVMLGHEALGVVEHALMQVSAVHIERRCLLAHRLDDVRIGVPHARHVVVHIDVTLAFGVEQVDSLAANDVEGLLVEERRADSEDTLTTCDQVLRRV